MNRYKIIYADPPWSFKNRNTGGSMVSGASSHYKVMSLKDICDLPVQDITDQDCILFLWWVASQPLEALQVVKAWGFELKTMTGFNWVKTTKNNKLHFGVGFYTRMGSESCLIAVKGRPKRVNAGIRSVEILEFAEIDAHSEKPEIFRTRIVELMGGIPRIELFARKQSPGWDVFGNEVENSIEFDFL